jgi:hypothetical protein
MRLAPSTEQDSCRVGAGGFEMKLADATGTSSTTDVERWVSCEIPGCAHRMPYSGRGAPPKYCGQTVEGLQHTRLTAHRLTKG